MRVPASVFFLANLMFLLNEAATRQNKAFRHTSAMIPLRAQPRARPLEGLFHEQSTAEKVRFTVPTVC